MFRKCYKHHKSDLIDIYLPASKENIDRVMQYFSSDSIILDIQSIFETYHLAVYLQMNCLQKLCLDHFTLNLNRSNLQSQLELIKQQSYLNEEFKRRALKFWESGNPSISGLYYLQKNNERSWCLKLKSRHSKSPKVLKEFKRVNKFKKLHCVDNMLCMTTYEGSLCNAFLFQYDLLSGNACKFALDSVNLVDDNKTIICTDSKNLYLFNQVNNKDNKSFLRLTMFTRKKIQTV